MDVALTRVPFEEKEVLRRWLEHYLHELAEFDGSLPHEDGSYGYRYLDHYFANQLEPRHAFWILADRQRAGFALVRLRTNETGRRFTEMSEFTVHHRFRGTGVARAAATMLFEQYTGSWHVQQHARNLRAVAFWRSVIKDFTGDNFVDKTLFIVTYQDFESTPGNVPKGTS